MKLSLKLTALIALTFGTAHAAPPTLRQLVELHDLSSLAASPDGRWIAYREDVASVDANRLTQTWWVAPTDGATPPRRLADGGAALWNAAGVALTDPPAWSRDGRFLYYRALIDGQVGVWRVSPTEGTARLVIQDPADVETFDLGADGQLTYSVGPTRAEILAEERRQADEGMLIDNKVDLAQSLLDAVEINGRPAVQRFTGKWFWRTGILGDRPKAERTVALGADGLALGQPVSAPSPGVDQIDRDLVSRDGFGKITLKQRPSGSDLAVTRADGRSMSCPATVCGADKVAAAAWRPGHDQVVLMLSDAFRANRLTLWEPATGLAHEIYRAKGSLQGGATNTAPCAITREAAICVASEAISPPRLIRIDLETSKTKVLAEPNTALDHGGLEARPLQWTTATGAAFTGQLLTRASAPRFTPLFLTYYNCRGYLRGGTGDEWPLIALAQAGMAVLCINKPTPVSDEQDAVADYERAASGISAIVEQLAAQGVIDPKRVGMGGHSFGSEVTTWVATHTSLLSAASISSLQLEPTYYWLNGVAGRDVWAGLRSAWKLGAPDETPDRWRALSPAANLAKLQAPLLMQLPEQELRASIELVARASHGPTPNEVRAFAREPHILTQPRHRLSAYERNLDWFRFWLLSETDPAPEKAEQTKRWREAAERWRSTRSPP
ncbi:Atxe2 family lasso peptide isopeptidase [Caulobacter sp.]|uniref:Atxe2 family lasso peptide isopeptidase n=1 Tax=Caulobacter sp. TaxID=78 RepID=UPI001B0FBBE2|nr:Atxe2 family lasso peptide isopeptidase [Caulobacter sp.]MBO9547119.1 Atxe2 family lasso peptide isopeptidase [Caulobacter sp.]